LPKEVKEFLKIQQKQNYVGKNWQSSIHTRSICEYYEKVGEGRENTPLWEDKRRAQEIQTLPDVRRRRTRGGRQPSAQPDGAGIRESKWGKTVERTGDPARTSTVFCSPTRVESGKDLY
jgi:hypothetical protein